MHIQSITVYTPSVAATAHSHDVETTEAMRVLDNYQRELHMSLRDSYPYPDVYYVAVLTSQSDQSAIEIQMDGTPDEYDEVRDDIQRICDHVYSTGNWA